MVKKYLTFSHFTLFVALCISAIAAWYSVIGLTAIFAGAVIPILIMGGILEVAKITTTVWLHRYWHLASITIKTYLTIAVVALACLTSMGIFGLLSKAHTDQSVVSGDVVAKVSLLDEKIKIQRDNIETARKALAQMDAQVDQRLSRSDNEQGAERAVQIRRQQARERNALQNEIAVAQKEIAKLNEERAPIAGQLRKVEAEVGPIKYIAALIYGDNPDTNLLERAVRWVTILIVAVFDPLAIVLILAANNSLKWDREKKNQDIKDDIPISKSVEESWEERIAKVENSTPWPTEWDSSVNVEEEKAVDSTKDIPVVTAIVEESVADVEQKPAEAPKERKSTFAIGSYKTNYMMKPLQWFKKIADAKKSNDEQTDKKIDEEFELDNVTVEKVLYDPDEEYVHYDGKLTSINALREIRPDLIASPTNVKPINFGAGFPKQAVLGEVFIRIDVMPHKVFKFNGARWIMLDKLQNTVYLQNENYIKYLIQKLEIGEYDVNELTSFEQDEISRILQTK